jgi:cobalt/nickel transport system permease protein
MHIPDGYLSPKTCIAFFGAMVPVWYIASRRAEKTVKLNRMPIFALVAAFSFVVMMFNIPVPGGSSGHMVGAVVLVSAVGPWASIVALSLTNVLQALIFGDGGITTLGANAFNMAFVMSAVGYFIYSAVGYGNPGAFRLALASAIAGYAAINASAFAAAIELGMQPVVASGADGRAMYFPYPMSVTLPAMMVPHLLFFGPIEAIGTAVTIFYIKRLEGAHSVADSARRSARGLWVMVLILIILAPLGLFATGTPWGEWTIEEMKALVGYAPEGMKRLQAGWKGVLPDYALPGIDGMAPSSVLYILSAFVGSVAIVSIIYLWSRIWRRG